MILAIDFDGTIVHDDYPNIGKEREGAVDTLRKLQSEGYKLILWTCRSGQKLAEAVAWCAERGVRFTTINENTRSQIQKFEGSDSRKVGASLYIDDRGFAPLPPWSELYEIIHDKVPTYADRVERAWNI